VVTVEIFEDLQCKDCTRLQHLLEETLLPLLGEEIEVVRRDFPLAKHPEAFALAAEAMAGMAGKGANFTRFIAAWNWTNLFQYAALVIGSLLGTVFGSGMLQIMSLLVVAYALWLEWFTTRNVLGVAAVPAAMFVLLDLAIGLFVQGIVVRVNG
jgi:hypothetical protein